MLTNNLTLSEAAGKLDLALSALKQARTRRDWIEVERFVREMAFWKRVVRRLYQKSLTTK